MGDVDQRGFTAALELVDPPPMSPPSLDHHARVFDALSEPVRLKILSRFVDDQCSCTSLEKSIPLAKSTISYHVKVLRNAGLLVVEKDGRFYNYHLARETFEFFVPGLIERLAAQGTRSG